jgi:hypothetical protein
MVEERGSEPGSGEGKGRRRGWPRTADEITAGGNLELSDGEPVPCIPASGRGGSDAALLNRWIERANLVTEATALRARMFEVAGHFLDDDPAHEAEVAEIRAGTGYQDAANDLYALGGLYEKHGELFAHDRKNDRAKDAREAKRVAHGAIGEAQARGAGRGRGRDDAGVAGARVVVIVGAAQVQAAPRCTARAARRSPRRAPPR